MKSGYAHTASTGQHAEPERACRVGRAARLPRLAASCSLGLVILRFLIHFVQRMEGDERRLGSEVG